MKRLILALLLLPSLALAQGVPLKSGASSDLATVDTNKNLRVVWGAPTRATYVASISAQACSAAVTVSLEASVSLGFKIAQICVNTSEATAGTGVTVSLQRRTTASSGGTAYVAEGTGATGTISKMDPGDANFGGVGRIGGTPGTAGAMLSQWAFMTGEVGTGAETVPSTTSCRYYGLSGDKMPVVQAGTANGVTINVSSAGTGGLAFCAVEAILIAE